MDLLTYLSQAYDLSHLTSRSKGVQIGGRGQVRLPQVDRWVTMGQEPRDRDRRDRRTNTAINLFPFLAHRPALHPKIRGIGYDGLQVLEQGNGVRTSGPPHLRALTTLVHLPRLTLG